MTADGVEVYPSMTVYGIAPWDDIETLYVEDNLKFASTIFPTGALAESCKFPVEVCYFAREAAEAANRDAPEQQT